MDYNVMETQLTGEYREVFSKAVLYAAMKNIGKDTADEKMGELYDLLLTAQSEGKPVSKLVGRDANRFCKDFFADYTIADRLKRVPVSLHRVAWFVFILELIGLIAGWEEGMDIFAIKADVSGYGAGLILCALMYVLSETVLAPIFINSKNSGKTGDTLNKLAPLAFGAVALPAANRNRKKGTGTSGWWWLIIALFIGLGIGVSALMKDVSIVIPVWPLLFGSAAYILIYNIAVMIWRKKNYGTIFNARRQLEQDSYYKNLENRDLEKILLEGWMSRFNRLEKRGKVTRETFLEKLLKEEQLGNKLMNIVFPAIMAVVWISSVLDVAKDSGLPDALFFATILGVIEFFIARWLIRSEKKQAALRTRHFDRCKASGMTLPDYIEEELKGF